MSHQNIEALNTQLAAARADLNRALASGEDTTDARYAIAHVENEIAALERAERERRAEESRQAAAEVERAAAEAAAKAHAAVEAAATVEGLAELSGEPLPPVARDPQIDAATAAVARARVALERAEDEYRPHAAKVAQLQQRIREKLASIDAISGRRLSGDERSGDAAELDMIRNDAAALDVLYGEAKNVAAAQDRRPAARADLLHAEQELSRQQGRAAFETSVVRVKQAEQVFVAAWLQMVELGRAGGNFSPWSAFQPSPTMRRAVTGEIVSGFRGPL